MKLLTTQSNRSMAIPFRREEPDVHMREMPTMAGCRSSPTVTDESGPLPETADFLTGRDSQIRSVKHAPTHRLSFMCKNTLYRSTFSGTPSCCRCLGASV